MLVNKRLWVKRRSGPIGCWNTYVSKRFRHSISPSTSWPDASLRLTTRELRMRALYPWHWESAPPRVSGDNNDDDYHTIMLVIRRHRIYGMNAAIATNGVAWSVCLSVCVCRAHRWALQKQLNRSRCSLGTDSYWSTGCRSTLAPPGKYDCSTRVRQQLQYVKIFWPLVKSCYY